MMYIYDLLENCYIDGAVATIMAVNRAIRNEGPTDSVYNERRIIVI